MKTDSQFLIDIDRILEAKAGAKAKYVPRFVVSYLKRIVHQDEINGFLRSVEGKVGVDFLEEGMKFLDTKLDVHGLENLPDDGRLCTFVSNHPWADRTAWRWATCSASITTGASNTWSTTC